MTTPVRMWLSSDNVDFNQIQLIPSSDPVAYDGLTSVPWTSADTTPFEVAGNDVVGSRFALTSPDPQAIQDGAPPAAITQRSIDLLYTNRTITIPIQIRATNEEALTECLEVLRDAINASVMQEPMILNVLYGSDPDESFGLVTMRVERGVFQEDYRFWSVEREISPRIMRGILTLECTIGWSYNTAFANELSIFGNGVAFYSTLPKQGGETRRSVGQPMNIAVIQPSSAVRTYFLASVAEGARSTPNESFVTSSTTGVRSTAVLSYSFSSRKRGTRYRALAYITSPNTHLQIRVEVIMASGATLYIGPWISVGTNTTLIDLGFWALPQHVRSYLVDSGRIYVGYRSSSGSATAGSLRAINAMEYYTFAKVTTTVSEDVYRFTNYDGGGESGGAPTPDMAFVLAGSPPDPIEQPAIEGQLPRLYAGSELWMAWLDAGVYNPSALAEVLYNAPRLFHTIGTPEPS